MRIDVFTHLPGARRRASARRACSARPAPTGCSTCACHDLREHTTDVHRTVDDAPVRRRRRHGDPRPSRCSPSVEAADPPRPLFLLGPGGRRFDQRVADELAAADGFSLLCGRYEGVDHRVREHLVDDELSVGDVVLSGGEVAACLVDRGRHPPAAGRDGQRREPGDRELRRERAARGAAVHPPGGVPRLGRCPTCCAAATTPASSAGAGRRRCTARCAYRPDLVDARGGLADDDRRLLEEFPPLTYP